MAKKITVHTTFAIESHSQEKRIGILTFYGKHKYGSDGNADADFIKDHVLQALKREDINGLVTDFRDMSYEWGNGIFETLYTLNLAAIACVVIYSKKSEAMVGGIDNFFFETKEQALEKILGSN
jgi:hypothetical protein